MPTHTHTHTHTHTAVPQRRARATHIHVADDLDLARGRAARRVPVGRVTHGAVDRDREPHVLVRGALEARHEVARGVHHLLVRGEHDGPREAAVRDVRDAQAGAAQVVQDEVRLKEALRGARARRTALSNITATSDMEIGAMDSSFALVPMSSCCDGSVVYRADAVSRLYPK